MAALKCTEHAIQEVVEGLKSDKAVIPAATPIAEVNSRPGGAGRLVEANEHHPEMRRALFHLRESKRELEKSAHDYDGHRVAAIKDAEQAIKEVVDGLKGDGKALAPGAEATSRPGEGRRAEAADRHPEMCKALFHLRESKRELEKSAHDFDGHRVAALKDTDQAIKEVVDGLKDDGKTLIPSAASIAEPASRPAEGRRAEVAERHPEMHRAMFHLREAKRELEKSAHDYEGHRVAAIKDAEQAIQEIVDGLKSDKT